MFQLSSKIKFFVVYVAKSANILFWFSLLSVTVLPAAATEQFVLPEPLGDADFHPVQQHQAELGQRLFYDKILSGNQNISCAACHHPSLGTADGLALGLGEGATELGSERLMELGVNQRLRRVPRHSPVLFNLGAKQFTRMFHDGRVEINSRWPSGFDSPADEFLPTGLSDIVAAQALFPILSEIEMAGQIEENEVAGATRRRADYAWDIVLERLKQNPEYVTLFTNAFSDVDSSSDIEIRHYANAVSAFIRFEWKSVDSPFDRYLSGDLSALNSQQVQGMQLFYGQAGCSSCHQGTLQTDHDFHSLGLPLWGPGRTRRFNNSVRDMGRINKTDAVADRYKFRTPSLRNLENSAPYGHNGAYDQLSDIVRHHLKPQLWLDQYTYQDLSLPQAHPLQDADLLASLDNKEQQLLRASISIEPVQLSEDQLTQILAFLSALNDPNAQQGRLGIPQSVPSGLAILRE
ncbi:methylamine utilization protein MauG [Alginatibacterium sediminis]|uniref:Methylamine utilization protein MauG n=1 Tax=Alginatibacterium sediminis TaxID=2164068 RepID=A0A420E761_9ALTE|nr:cytochrome c peroxidase [Alginatibacterium sediminis]RKF14304.1 methylamine utilization protein MauG [Alginatibacterium sediminis]